MSSTPLPLSRAATLQSGAPPADVASRAIGIATGQCLDARVMAGTGETALLVRPGALPLEQRRRPPEAAALENAGLVVRFRADLTPRRADAMKVLAGETDGTGPEAAEGVPPLQSRDGAPVEAPVHDQADCRPRPFVVRGVQHVPDGPEPWTDWTGPGRQSRIVVLARDSAGPDLQRSLDWLRAAVTPQAPRDLAPKEPIA